VETTSTSADFAEAVRLHQKGDLDRAESLYRRVLATHPDHANAIHLLGVLEHQRGRHVQAIDWISQAIVLDPSRPDYRNSLGVVFRAQGRLDDAAQAHREALSLDPIYPDALSNLGVVLHELGRLAEARVSLQDALRIAPHHVNAAFALANLLQDIGESTAAVTHYRHAHALAPARADILGNLGIALAATENPDEALTIVRKAATDNPTDPAIQAGLGRSLERMDLVEEAADAYSAAARLRPGEGHWPVRIATLCPAVFPSAEAIDRYRIGLEAVLDAHRAGLRLAPADLVDSGCVPSFQLAHHGRDDRVLKAKFAALFRDVFPPREPSAGSGIPHLGFVVTRGREGGFLRSMAGIIDQLDPGAFRLTLFAAPGGLPILRAGLVRSDVGFVPLPRGLPEAIEQIASARCDVLYHWQIGSDPLGYFLPFTRLAPVQCTSWGTHSTSGIPAVDYYLSSELIEPPGAEAHYTERLIKLATLPTYQRPIHRPNPPAVRSEFGLPSGRPLYACLQRAAKFHPDFDAVLAGILRRDPAGLILLVGKASDGPAQRLRERWLKTMPDVADRLLFLGHWSATAYQRVLSLAEVMLDPFPYGSGLTAYDALGMGIPIVTLPGHRQVGRYVLGCYARMGLAGPVADSADRYLELAVRMATDAEYRCDLSQHIETLAPLLFEDASVVAEHGRVFERLTTEARSR
jgi:protein O-GlcNAc transferase